MLAAELLEACQALVEDVQRGAIAQADALVVAEGDAWNSGDLVAGEEFVAEIHRLKAGISRVNKEVEGAQWLHDADVVNGLEASQHELPLDIVFATEVFDEGLVPFQGSEGAVLGEAVRV